MKKYRVFVFANLKPSQIFYKIIPLSNSEFVEKVYVLRKEPLDVGVDKIECIALPIILRVRPFYWFFTAFYGVYLIRKNKSNIILNYNIFPHGFNSYLASMLSRKPLIFAEINEDTLNYYQQTFVKPLIKKILNKAAYITVPGTKTETRWRTNGYDNLVQLHSTINTEIYSPKIKDKKFDFLFIGEFDDNKRPDLILNAFNEIRSSDRGINICFIGFGKKIEILEHLILEMSLDKHVSIIKTNRVLEYLWDSKILVMASLSEGIPCAMLEAMSCELIVVVPPVGDIADVVKHNQNGILHDNSLQDIKDKMLEAYNNYNELGEMRAKARETVVREHSYQSATKKWNDLLAKI